jgi:AcrR family transcriptional regulator
MSIDEVAGGMRGGAEDSGPPVWPSPGDRLKEREQKRAAVMRAAVRLFNERGFRATSLDEVARSLSITKPTLYNYFASKEEVLYACVRLGIEMIERAAAAGSGPGGGLDRLRALIRAYAEVMTMDFGRCVVRVAEHELSLESRQEFRQLKGAIDRTLRQVISDGVRDGSIAACDVKLAAFAVAGSLNWIGHWYDPAGPSTAGEIAETMVRQLVAGLQPR